MADLEKNYARQFGANVYVMAQQKYSRLRQYVTMEPFNGEMKFLDRVHPTEVTERTSKYGDSPMIPTLFDRRALKAREFEWGDMLDWTDDLNLFIDPTSKITQAGSSAFGRKLDQIIIQYGFEGIAYEGKTGDTAVSFPSSQVIPITTGSGSSPANVGLNIEKLRAARSLFGTNEVDEDDPEGQLYFGIAQAQLDDLLRTTEVTSADYNTVKALVQGAIDTFMGFKFVKTQKFTRTALETGYSRNCVAWCKSGVVLGMPQEITMRASERSDKGYNWYAYGKMKGGCTRLEDAKVVHVPCLELA